MNTIFGENGKLNQILSGFEFREEQLAMADFINERLCNNDISFIEAGTGTGKTLAYLIPVILFALNNDKKVTLSTETKALQKQLVAKDLPLIDSIIKDYGYRSFKYALCLGSWNYPCLNRFESLIKKGSFSPADMESIELIGNMFMVEKVFTFFDATVSRRVWNEINRETDACNSFRCRNSSKCVYLKAKKEWNEADLLIMNHYLYFTNIASGKTYLPQSEITVFDEAHSIEDIASQQLGFTISREDLLESVSLFTHTSRKSLLHGVLDSEVKDSILQNSKGLTAEIEKYFNRIEPLISGGSYTRIKETLPFGKDLVTMLKSLMMILSDLDDSTIDETRNFEMNIARGRLFLMTENLNIFINQMYDNYVYWIDRAEGKLIGDINLKCQPVAVSEIVGPEFTNYESCFFLSATLAINGDFSYIARHLGIGEHTSIALDTSFDYKSQAVLYIDKTLADPGKSGYAGEAAMRSIEIIESLNGNCLLLFTSYKMLREVKEIILENIDYPVFSQDEYEPAVALDLYMNSSNAVLLGTHSFWQGIDLPGDLLKGVVLMRLPFSVPDTPVMEARIEMITAQGGNPFFDLQVPEAVLKFKQGFGRLIRRKSDKGIVAVLDSRVVNKSYGKYFLRSIPECTVVHSIEKMKEEYNRIKEM